MMQSTPGVADPLANIEDMLTSLCGAQSGGHKIGEERQNKMYGKEGQIDISNAEEAPTTPEKSTSSKDCPKRAQSRRKTRARALKRFPPSNGIRKYLKGRGERRAGQRASTKAIVPRDFDDDGGQQGQDLLGASSDDPENKNFLNQMKRLTEEQLDAQKRKNDAMNVQAVSNMQRYTDQCIQKMQQIAGKVSSDIINRAAEIEEALPSETREQASSAMNAVRSARDGISDFKEQAKTFDDQIDKLVRELQAQRKENTEKCNAEEKEKLMNVKAFCASGQRLISVLQEIEKMTDVDQFKSK